VSDIRTKPSTEVSRAGFDKTFDGCRTLTNALVYDLARPDETMEEARQRLEAELGHNANT
jgi:hypothetical protein